MTVFYLCGSGNTPYGGNRVIYRHVDILNRMGISARAVHDIPNSRYGWFENSTKVSSLPVVVTDADVLVIPENWTGLLRSLARGVPKVSFNQNAFTLLRTKFGGGHPYLTSADLLATMTVSEHNLALLQHAFPNNRFERIHISVDPSIFHLADHEPKKTIAYMTRKRASELQMLLNILQTRGTLHGWDTVVIDGMSQGEVARTLRSASLFLSFSHYEGCPLGPLEALASGCSVIGFTGFGGNEYFKALGAIPIPEGDIKAFAEEVEFWIRNFDPVTQSVVRSERSEETVRWYSPRQEEDEVVAFWTRILSEMPPSKGIEYTLNRRDLRKGSLRTLIQNGLPYMRSGFREISARTPTLRKHQISHESTHHDNDHPAGN